MLGIFIAISRQLKVELKKLNVSFDLVIFDCDGVLVDSERLAIQVDQEVLAELGWILSIEEVVERFVGRSNQYFKMEVENHLKIKLPQNWSSVLNKRYRQIFKKDLTSIPGVESALDRITQQTCVASSGSFEKIEFTLGHTGLLPRFDGRIFSADQVTNGKPAPDLFQFAAAQLDVAPDRCVVVEDSPAGIQAGLSAGMTVIAFSAGLVPEEKLKFDGVQVLTKMDSLPDLLETFG